MFENPRRGRQAKTFTTTVNRSQIVFRTDIFRKLPLGTPDYFGLKPICTLGEWKVSILERSFSEQLFPGKRVLLDNDLTIPNLTALGMQYKLTLPYFLGFTARPQINGEFIRRNLK